MKKYYFIFLLLILAAMAVSIPALANQGEGAIKGQVVAIDPIEGRVTLESKRAEFIEVILPEDFDPELIELGDWLLVKGINVDGNTITAEWVKVLGNGKGKGNDNKAEGKQDNSAFCDPGKQDKFHPLVEKIGERFGVGDEWVMDYFCEGYGMGAIMLALKTSQIEGSPAEDLLKQRAEGKGWGQIWKEKGLIGSENEGVSPPGHLKKPDHAGPKDNDQ